MIDVKQRAGELGGWLLALPRMVQAAAVVGLLLVALWLFGGLQSGWAYVRDWWDDRKVTELQAENDKLRLDAAKKDGEVTQLKADLAAKDAELQALHGQAKIEDANVATSKKRYNAARAGHAASPIHSTDELDDRLRKLFASEAQ